MPVLAQGRVQLALQVRQRTGLRPRCRCPPRDSGGEALFPSVKPLGVKTQLLGDHSSGLTALEPVLDCFTFECFVEFTTDFDRCLLHVLHHCSPDSLSVNSAQPHAVEQEITEETESSPRAEMKNL